MENDAQLEQGWFTVNDIHCYLRDGCYPDGYTKPDKLALRKRAKFFCARGVDVTPSLEKLIARAKMDWIPQFPENGLPHNSPGKMGTRVPIFPGRWGSGSPFSL